MLYTCFWTKTCAKVETRGLEEQISRRRTHSWTQEVVSEGSRSRIISP